VEVITGFVCKLGRRKKLLLRGFGVSIVGLSLETFVSVATISGFFEQKGSDMTPINYYGACT